MTNISLKINAAEGKTKITSFLQNTLQKEGFENVIIAMSSGIDSTTSFYLLKDAIPSKNIFVAHLYYFDSQFKDIEPMLKEAKIPKENIYEVSVESLVEAFNVLTSPHPNPLPQGERAGVRDARVRLGNIMARVRMIILYDLAKKHNALVCGTENKSEFLLGYFTRFGDQASDFEPMQHLYKTQVYQLASFLNVPKKIIDKEPTAGLWHGQTDEGEFGFTYQEADQVLYLHYDKKLKLEEIRNRGFKNAEKIIGFSLKNSYKHITPYIL